jgi:hypothetical protein
MEGSRFGRKRERNIRDYVFYLERSSNQYEIFWVKFLEELFHWIDRLPRSSTIPRTHQEDMYLGYREDHITSPTGSPYHMSSRFLGS